MNTSKVKSLVETVKTDSFKGIALVSGINEGQTAAMASKIFSETERQILIITSSYEKAKVIEEHLAFFAPETTVFMLPDEERSLFSYDAKSRILSHRRIQGLSAAMAGRKGIFTVPVMGAVKGMCSPEKFRESVITLKTGDDIDVAEIRSALVEMGYERADMTEVCGQFSMRGGIIDIFPPDLENPLRIDLFDTEIDSIKQFDPMTQRSVSQLEAVSVPPAVMPDAVNEETAGYLWEYISDDALIIADDWDRICESRDLADRDWTEGADVEGREMAAEVFADMYTLAAALEKRASLVTLPLKKTPKYIERLAANFSISCMPATVFNGRMDNYAGELKRLLKEGFSVTVACATAERQKSLADYAMREEISGNIDYREGYLPSGFYFTADMEAYISDNDIFRSVKKRKKKRKPSAKQIKAFTNLKKGDYVVHENHGIGRFIGIEPLVVEGVRKDYMTIQYAGKDMLYVPVEQMDLVQTYIGSGGAAPKINKLSSGDWKKTKARAKAAIAQMAEELVRLSAERTMEEGFSFSPDTPWQRQFEDMFPFQETDNQLRCIEEIKRDMELPWPMDRLLCGDVGFGKTEIAARAVFKCIMDGKQAAVLVPTTILANQHYHTFKDRFETFPCSVDMLCRFRNEKEQAKTIQGLEDGSVDVIIGTHRILSKDVKFKDLGLLVIDEEQRFGVQHKEAIKYLKKNVDVLTLSATPIPRTLHMSLSGIRKMSTLEEPPEDRYPVQTYVLEQDEKLIREIIMRELDRDGQVFILYNRVRGIYQVAEMIRQLVPEARVQAAHGQMNEKKLEDIMQSFMEHKFDVIVATTIIESGIDVPNANTLIILDADNFGLAQLYQLKGRVGRSNRAAYAYFMYQKNKVLSEIATKRLKAIREFTEFGSGFRIAMKDLEIRGAGNLLGTEQSGHMMQIGYELYCKLIDDAVRKLRGEKVKEEPLEVAIELKVQAYISSDYIADEKLKLDMYKRIAEIRTAEDMSDVTDELIDRFGDVPQATVSLMQVAYIQARCRNTGIKRVGIADGNRIIFEFVPELNTLTPEVFAKLSDVYGMKLLINMSSRPFIKLPFTSKKVMLDEIIDFLIVLEEAGAEA